MKMKPILWLCAVIIVAAAAAWGAAKLSVNRHTRSESARQPSHTLAPAPGRIDYVMIDALSSSPEKFDGKRLITGGRWLSGTHENYLVTYDEKIAPPNIGIRLEFDWSKLKEPFGDLSKNANVPLLALSDWLLIAEGTFLYRKEEANNGVLLVDRIYNREPINEKEPAM